MSIVFARCSISNKTTVSENKSSKILRLITFDAMASQLKSLGVLNKYFRKYKYYVLGGILFITISNYFRVLQPQYFREAMDMVIDTVSMHAQVRGLNNTHLLESYIAKNLIWFSLFIIGQAIIMGVFMYLMRQTIIVMSRLVEYDMRKEIYNHAQYLDATYYNQHATGDLMARVTEDVSKVRQYIGPAVLYGINLITLFIMVIYSMFSVNTELSIYTLIPLPFLSWGIYKISEVINQRSTEIQTQLSRLSSISVEVFSGIRTVKSYTQESRMGAYFAKESDDYLAKNMARIKVDAWFFPIMLFVIGVSSIFTLWVGGNQVLAGEVSPGNIAEFFIYITLLTWPITSLGWTASLVQQAAASQTRINEFMGATNSFENKDRKVQTLAAEIRFENVSLVYPDTGIKALDQVSFVIPKGSKTAIIGETASGKSSIAYLLMQLYRPTGGRIVLDDVNIEEYDVHHWRSKTGYVPQDSFLFSDTVANNIAFGMKGETTIEEVSKYAGYAAVHEDIIGLPDGYETIVGERGVTLSGGQKQRVSIARALISNPELLILDNSLSAVDTDTELKITRHLNSIKSNTTMIVITQRVNTMFEYDNIITLARGKVIEMGNHQELMEKRGYYYRLFQKQNENSGDFM